MKAVRAHTHFEQEAACAVGEEEVGKGEVGPVFVSDLYAAYFYLCGPTPF